MARLKETPLFVFLLLLISASITEQNSRAKRQIASSQPRMMTQNGHLIFQSGTNHNITFRSSGGGAITIDGQDIRVIAQTVTTNKQDIERLKTSPTQIPSNINNRLNSLQTSVNSLQNIPGIVNTLRNSVSTITANLNTGNSRLTAAENRISSGQNQLSARLSTVENRIRSLTNSSANDLVNRVRRLEQQMSRLQTLLTTNECQSNPCLNGGTCLDNFNGFICRCPNTWTGMRCEIDVNECSIYAGSDLGCQNGGTCINTPGSFSCTCAPNWHGVRCTSPHDDCSSSSEAEICGHGTCVNLRRVAQGQPKYKCLCDDGWTKSSSVVSAPCTIDVDECSTDRTHPCSQNPLVPCHNYPGGFGCGSCPAGYTGNGYTCQDVNECETNNGGCSMAPFVQCQNTVGSYVCPGCPGGYQGDGRTCTWVGICGTNNGGCYHLATCRETPGITGRSCTCPSGYVGNGIGPTGCTRGSQTGACSSNPCQNGAACTNTGSGYSCSCRSGYTGTNCETDINECDSNPCRNGGTCRNLVGSFQCTCTEDYTGVTCSDSRNACGGRLNQANGTIRFPRQEGSTYPHGVVCTWTITTQRNKIIHLSFSSFDVESHTRCNFDYLQINDGPSSSSVSLGRFCGGHEPPSSGINSTFNTVQLTFTSDSSVAGHGFVAQWTSADPVCGGDISGSNHGSISSPGYPANYPHLRDCTWTVTVSPGKRIMFTFATLRLEHHTNCSYDYLEIRDGTLESSSLIDRFCSTETPGPVTTTGSYAVVKFHSDAFLNDRGFHITYVAVHGVCGGQYTSDEGVITSPNYPHPYQHNARCYWTITVSEGDRIFLTFTAFDLETSTTCAFDYVEVRDGLNSTSDSLGRFCGTDNPAPVHSTGNKMYIFFRSDSSLRGSGFRATWTVGCGGTFTTPTGALQSPSYPHAYPSNKECIYIIRQRVGFRVTLTFQAFDLEAAVGTTNCQYDYLEIRNGGTENSDLLGRFCGSDVPGTQITTQNLMWIKFKTDGSVTDTGFHATYTSEEMACGSSLTGEMGRIRSPGYPNVYPHGANCTWYITVPQGMVIRLTFHTFNLEQHRTCNYDYVAVYDNSTANADSLIGRYCGSRQPPTLTSSDNVMTIKFTSDTSIAHGGFSASYVSLNVSTVCGADLQTLTGTIQSPNYPNNYPNSRLCTWTITVPAGHQILINITVINIEYASNCRYDYLEIRNGGYRSSPLVGKYCGNKHNTIIRSHGNRMWLEFKTDYSESGMGFFLTYDGTVSGCGGDLTTPTGSFISPNYPLPYNHNAECFWTVTVARGNTIHLVFSDFNLERSSSHCFDYVEVREGGPQGRRIAKFCDTFSSRSLRSETNKLWVKFRSDSSVSERGFQAFYTTVCSNTLSGYSGVIESPNFPNEYPHRQNCTWVIGVTQGNRMNISFSHFDITSPTCNNNRLQIRDGSSQSAPLIGNLCNTMPSRISSTSEHTWLNLITDSFSHGTGFRLEWITVGCGGPLTGTRGTFTSPNYPNFFPLRTECVWTITVLEGKSIKLTISNINISPHRSCNIGFLEVYGGPDMSAPKIAKLCHRQTTAQVLVTTGNTMVVRFKSGFYNTRQTGFSATYEAQEGGCGGNFTTPQGMIVSKNYPDKYPAYTDCEWLITVQTGQSVTLTFQDFSISSRRGCQDNYVAVYDGPDSTYTQLTKSCGTSLPSPRVIQSSSNQMYIIMRINSTRVAKGFKAKYETGCGGSRNADVDGVIFSPNYPQAYSPYLNCTWVIQASQSSDKVTLTFTHMDIERSQSCSADFVSVLDGDDADAPAVGGSPLCGTTVPAPVVSQGNSLVVTFNSDATIQKTGFRATYTKSLSSCGGDFTAESGTLVSPSYPNGYPANTECVWTMHVSPGNKILISFSVFSLDTTVDPNCNGDYVELRAGNVSGRVIGRYCSNNRPSNITAFHGIWMKFRSDGQGTGQGFSATYNFVYGGSLTGRSGQLASPLYPNQYPHRAHYTWTITVPIGMNIRVSFVTFDIESGSPTTCFFDFLEFRDGGLPTSPLIGSFCGPNLPSSFLSTTNQLLVTFVTDRSVSGGGFLFNWQATSEVQTTPTTPATTGTPIPGCGGELVATGDYQTFQSPGYPSSYRNRLNCVWHITTTAAISHIIINITDIDLEGGYTCPYDSVTVYDGVDTHGQLLGSFCGRSGDIVSSNTDKVTITFVTDSSITASGFSISYKSECGQAIQHQESGVIQSPNYPDNYPANQNCSWSVTVLRGRTVRARFNTTFNIPSTSACDTDYVMLLNGGDANAPPLGNGTNEGNTLGHYCGNRAPVSMETSNNGLFLNFVSDGSGSGSGFQLIFQEVTMTCGGHFRLTQQETSGIFTSPNYPDNYPPNVDCVWVIVAPSLKRIQIDFSHFEIEQAISCHYDYVEIRDGGTENAPPLGSRLCGSTLPNTQVSTGNVIYVRFRTDSGLAHSGFSGTYSIAVCGGRMSGRQGVITSPNFPNFYDANNNCEWTITAPTGHFLTFTFLQFNVEQSANCSSDYLEIRDLNATGTLLYHGCGIGTHQVTTSDSYAYVHFVSNGNIQKPGFKLRFTASVEACGGELTTPTGIFSSPNFPGSYPHNRRCEWNIIVPTDRRVTLTFSSFQLEANSRCPWDYVRIYNGISAMSPSIGNFCGTRNPGTIESSGNKMKVVFKTDGSVTNSGFQASYTSENDQVCGGQYNSPGNISISRNSTLDYSHSLYCEWLITNPTLVNSSVKISLLRLRLEETPACNEDVLEMREGISENGKVLRRLCGRRNVKTIIVSPRPQIFIRFINYHNDNFSFYLEYSFQDCGGVLTSPFGVITSPNYPSDYNANEACAWQILAPEGTRIRIIYDDLSIENHTKCHYDSLEIFNGGYPDSPSIGKFCDTIPPHDFISQSNSLRLVFKSDFSIQSRGFRLHYRFETEACGGLFHSNSGFLSSPNFPHSYPNNEQCIWDISVDNGYVAVLVFNPPFSLEINDQCRSDYVQVSDVLTNGTETQVGKWCGNRTPPRIKASTRRLIVKFRSGERVTGTGFSANWTTACGGLFTSDSGIIISPGYPNNYANNLLCNYTIAVDPQKFILVQFFAFTLQLSSACSNDYVKIYSGNDTSGRMLTHVCGSRTPSPLSSLGTVFIQFRSDSSINFRGFEIKYRAEECGGVYTEPEGRIHTPSNPAPYHYNANCMWNITVSDNMIVELKFILMSLEAHPRCNFDYVAVYDGDNIFAPLLGRFCGQTIPQPVHTTGNTMLINFITDSSVSGAGFSAFYRETYGPAMGCGGYLNSSSGELSSLDVDNDGLYENGLNCRWTIDVGSGKMATLNITGMDIERHPRCSWDSLRVYDGPSTDYALLGEFCQTTSEPQFIVGSSNALYVIFKTDSSVQKAGFNATYGQQNALCGGVFIANNTAVTISSPNYPNPAGQSVRCRWTIDASSRNKKVRLIFTGLSLVQDPNCRDEYVQLRDFPMSDNGKSVHYCGNTIPPSFDSVGRSVQVIYNIPTTSTSHGFQMTYQIATCNRNFTGDSGRITSPGYPSNYPHNVNCSTYITTPPGTTLALYFTHFIVEPHRQCLYDYLRVYNGTSSSDGLMGNLCGGYLPDTIFIPGNIAYLNFKTDFSVSHKGYDISYVSTTAGLGCGGNLTGLEGSLTSPGYPSNYSDVATCVWTIRVPARRVVNLQFTVMSVPGVARCAENYVAVYNGASDSAPMFGRYCDTRPASLTTSGNSAFVKFVSTGTSAAPTFRLVYSSN